jgi:site-specific DNA recombinase
MLRAARYRRVSTESQEDNTSLEEQLDRMNAYCKERNYLTTDDTLYTEIMTGVVWRERPKLQRMLKDAAEGKFDVVVIDHLDRFGRGEPVAICMEELSFHNVRLECVQVKIEDTDEGRLLVYLHSYSSKKEYGRIVKRTKDGRMRHLREGKLLGGVPKYGYMWNSEHTKYLPDPKERLVVERIFSLAKGGMTVRSIAKVLNDEGIPARKGGLWRHNTVSAILRDPIYCGEGKSLKRLYGMKGAKRTRTIRPVADQIPISPDTVPQLVDKETFTLVQKQIDYNKRTALRNNPNAEKALARTIALCGYCGGKLHAMTDRNGTRTTYLCPRRRDGYTCTEATSISAKILDDAIWQYACSIIRDPKKRQKAIDALKKPHPILTGEKGIANRKKEIEAELENLVDMGRTAKNKTSLAKINGWISLLEEELEILLQEEKKTEKIRDNWGEVEKEIKRFEYWCQTWEKKLNSASYQDKRTVIEYLGIIPTVFKFGSKPRIKMYLAPPNLMEKLGFVSASSR